MQSSLFYPIALFSSVGLVTAALAPGFAGQRELRERIERVQALGYVIEGEGLDGFTDITGVTHLIVDGGALTRARIIASHPQEGELQGSGAFVTIPPPVADLFGGQEVRVTVTARRATVTPSTEYSVAYIVPYATQSAWAAFEPADKFQDQSFTYTPPDQRNPDGAWIGIWPDTSGERGAIEVLSIRVELTSSLPG